MAKDKHPKGHHDEPAAEEKEVESPVKSEPEAATATMEAPKVEPDAVVTPMSTPTLPAEWGGANNDGLRLDQALKKITNATAKGHLYTAINTVRTSVQGYFNDSTGDLTRAPQRLEQIRIDDACIYLAQAVADIFRNT